MRGAKGGEWGYANPPIRAFSSQACRTGGLAGSSARYTNAREAGQRTRTRVSARVGNARQNTAKRGAIKLHWTRNTPVIYDVRPRYHAPLSCIISYFIILIFFCLFYLVVMYYYLSSFLCISLFINFTHHGAFLCHFQ